MKVYGPRVIVESEGDVVVFTTGREYERVGRALTAGRDVWLVIEAEGRVVVRSHAALTTALSNPWISWSPEIAAAEPHVVVAERPDFLLPGLTILAVAFAGAVALHARFTRDREPSGRVPTSSLTPETCLAEASHAATAGQWGRALEWTQRSRRLAPKSARLALDEAFALKQLGDVDGAIEAYGEAAALGDDGVAEFSAARLAAFADRPAVVVAIWLERAVARDPGFADEARLDPDLARYAGDPRVARIIGSG
ncbi:MAG TPA: hypothetical protein VM889_06120 [Candidatus Thermoplasmatota archaeon]|nr:hypothetical protein [Candidatus Thermoplasmatota archaeon]